MIEATNRPRRRKRRRRMHAIYVRNCTMCTIVALLAGLTIGFGCGWVAGNNGETKSNAVQSNIQTVENGIYSNQTVITTANPMPTTSVVSPFVADSNGIAWGTIENPFKIGNAYSLMADTTEAGETHSELSTTSISSQNLSVSMVDFYTPEHYEYFYGDDYKLSGAEAAVVLRISSNEPCNPQTAIILNLETAGGEVIEGHPLMDAAISGEYVTENAAGKSIMVYKRFQYDANNPAVYLTLTHFYNGQAIKAYFLLESASDVPTKQTSTPITYTPQPDITPTPTPITSHPTIAHGDCGDAVTKLQERLIELGYLTGEADGIFGNMTQTAVYNAQMDASMNPTGVADDNFQQYIYSEKATNR